MVGREWGGLRGVMVCSVLAGLALAAGVEDVGALHHDELRVSPDGGAGELHYELSIQEQFVSALFYVESLRQPGLVSLRVLDSSGTTQLAGDATVADAGWVEFELTGAPPELGEYDLMLSTSDADLTFQSLEVVPLGGWFPRTGGIRRGVGVATGLFRSSLLDTSAEAVCTNATVVLGSPYIEASWVDSDGGTLEQQMPVEVPGGGIYYFIASTRGVVTWTTLLADGGTFPLRKLQGNPVIPGGLGDTFPVWATGGEWRRLTSGPSLNACDPAVRASFGGSRGRAIGGPVGSDFVIAATYSVANFWCRDADLDRDSSHDCTRLTGFPSGGSGWLANPTRYDCDDTNPLVHRRAEELCNGYDDDCDGVIDGTDIGQVPACSEQRGICVGATQQRSDCVAGVWQACSAASFSSAYGLPEDVCSPDFNCDGNPGTALVPCHSQRGVCAGSGSRDCSVPRGQCTAEDYGPHYEPRESSCDGLDNDCDGVIDNSATLRPCERTLGMCMLARPSPESCTAAGQQPCGILEYGSPFEENERSCDGIDNDCDGLTDVEDPDVNALPCERTVGVCAGAVHPKEHCTVLGLSVCSDESYGVSFERVETRCDGLDNDCDGVRDEGCEAMQRPQPFAGCGCHSGAELFLAVSLLLARRRKVSASSSTPKQAERREQHRHRP